MSALTHEQLQAVAAEGNVLVMAAAGTGKTSTLVARVLDRISREANPGSIDRIVLATFTEAAANEMRRRIRTALEEIRRNRPEALFPAEQLARLDRASIGTLHSFCRRL